MKRLTILAFTLALALAAHAASDSAGAPAIAFTGTTVRVSGITPGGTVVIYGVTLVRVDFADHVERFRNAVSDDDHDGIVTWDIGKTVPQDGMWVAVDATNGQFVVGTPRFGIPVAAPPSQLLRKTAGLVDTFAFDYSSVEAVYIHPGHGVWAVHAYDRGVHDHDSRQGVTAISLADAVSLLPAGETKATEFAPGGVLVAFDLPYFRVFTRRLTGADIGGAR